MGTTPLADLDGVDLAQRHRENREKVWLERHLAHPDPTEALVAQLREVVDGGVDRRLYTFVS